MENLHLLVFLVSLISLWRLTKHVSLAQKKRLHFTGCDTSLIYMRKTRGPRIDPCCTPLNTHAGWENIFPKLTKKVLFMR